MSNSTITSLPTEAAEVKTPCRIHVDQPEKFDQLVSTALETTQKLAKRINALMHTAFVDYKGCVIYTNPGNGNVNPNNVFAVELHFKPVDASAVSMTETRKRAFRPIEESVNKQDIVANLQSIYGKNGSSKFEMTIEASQILSEFMLNGLGIEENKPATYDRFKFEFQDNQTFGFGAPSIAIKVAGLDIIKLIKKIYGSRSENGKKLEYIINPLGPVVPMGNQQVNASSNWRVAIMQLDTDNVFETATEFGFANAGMGPVVTGTI